MAENYPLIIFNTTKGGDPREMLAEITIFDSIKPRRAKGFTFRLWLSLLKLAHLRADGCVEWLRIIMNNGKLDIDNQ